MELKIEITPENKDHIMELIPLLLDAEQAIDLEVSQATKKKSKEEPQTKFFGDEFGTKVPLYLMALSSNIRKKPVGFFGMFNSFVPGKASMRVLLKLMTENSGNPVSYSQLVTGSVEAIKKYKLTKVKGFPKLKPHKIQTSIGRFSGQLVKPLADLGLISFLDEKKGLVGLTKAGLQFTKLKNPVLDEGLETPLSKEEIIWLKKYLKEVDSSGFKEYSVLTDLREFLKNNHKTKPEDIANWFYTYKPLKLHTQNTSRHKGNSKNVDLQLKRIAKTYASGKVAVLRELHVVTDQRGLYNVIGTL